MKKLLLFCCFILASSSAAEEFDFGEDSKKSKTSLFSIPIKGNVSAESGRQFGEDPRWQRLGVATQLTFDWNTNYGQFFSHGNARYNASYDIEEDPDPVPGHYRFEGILRELYWSKSFGPMSFTLGKTIVVWGKADALVVTDVLSPRDQTDYFFARPEETRIGQQVVKIDYFSQKQAQHSFIFIPVPSFNRNAQNGHPYSLTTGFNLSDRESDRNPEIGWRSNFSLSGGEIALLAGYFHNRDPLIATDGAFLEETYVRSPIFGTTGTLALDPFLIKIEIAFNPGKPYQKLFASVIPTGYQRVDTLSAVLGADYVTADMGTFLFEISVIRPFQNIPELSGTETRLSGAIGWSEDFLNEDLSLSVFGFMLGRWQNIFGRIGADYKLADDWKLKSQITIISADPKDALFSRAAKLDRFDLSIEYYFDLAQR